MVTKYDIDTLYHLLELKQKYIYRKELKPKSADSKIIAISKNSYLKITKYSMVYNIITDKTFNDTNEVNLLEKLSLEHLSNLTIDRILIKLKLKKRLESSHSYYCEFCESWIKDMFGFRSAHISEYHLPIELE